MAVWHKRYSRDALNGMRGLSPEERGFYTAVLDLIYEEEGPVSDAMVRVEMGVTQRGWTFAKLKLIAKGKLVEVADGRVTNRRAMYELSDLDEYSARQAKAGQAGGRTRAAREKEARRAAENDLFVTSSSRVGDELGTSWGRTRHESAASDGKKGNVINGSGQASLKPARAPDTDTDTDKTIPPRPPLAETGEDEGQDALDESTGKSRLKSRRAQPLPPGWEPHDLEGDVADMTTVWANGELKQETEKFRTHAVANGRTCKDWNAAFRNWLINADQYRSQRRAPHDKPSGWRFTL